MPRAKKAASTVWIGTFEVKPRPGTDFPEDAGGAFVNTLAMASSEADFRARASQALDALGFDIKDVENVGPYARVEEDAAESVAAAAAEAARSGEVCFDDFHCYPKPRKRARKAPRTTH